MRLERAMEELEKVNGNARQAVIMADEAQKAGNTAKVTALTAAAESFATRLIAIEGEVESLRQLDMQSAQASDQAKASVQQNAPLQHRKHSEPNQLPSPHNTAKLPAQVKKAMTKLSQKRTN